MEWTWWQKTLACLGTISAMVSIIPLLVVFIGAQRFLVRGQTVGAVKG